MRFTDWLKKVSFALSHWAGWISNKKMGEVKTEYEERAKANPYEENRSSESVSCPKCGSVIQLREPRKDEPNNSAE